MASSLPERIDPRRFARAGRSVEGSLPARSFERLLAVLVPTSDVQVRLRFGLEQGAPMVSGRVSVAAEVQCQRCLEKMAITVEARVGLAVVEPGRASPGEQGDILEVDDGPLSLVTLVEDELLLAVPDYPMHDQPCAELAVEPAGVDSALEPAASPFAVLQTLKRE